MAGDAGDMFHLAQPLHRDERRALLPAKNGLFVHAKILGCRFERLAVVFAVSGECCFVSHVLLWHILPLITSPKVADCAVAGDFA